MRTVELTPRLRSVAELVPRGARFADVGTDHAYLPVWLLQQGRITGAVASDLRPGPLERARGTAEKYGLTGRMDFRLCDGLSGIQPDEVNTIAMAGMGGETIAAILAAAPWTWERECLLLLQPMSAQPFLRRHLRAGSCALLWLTPNYLYLAMSSDMTVPPRWVISLPQEVVEKLAGVWLAGALVVLGWKIFSHLRFRRWLLRGAEEVSDRRCWPSGRRS